MNADSELGKECIICMQCGENDKMRPICELISFDSDNIRTTGEESTRSKIQNQAETPPQTCRIHHRCSGHAHQICIGKWLDRNPTCPMCRSSVTASSGQSTDDVNIRSGMLTGDIVGYLIMIYFGVCIVCTYVAFLGLLVTIVYMLFDGR